MSTLKTNNFNQEERKKKSILPGVASSKEKAWGTASKVWKQGPVGAIQAGQRTWKMLGIKVKI